MNMRKAFSQASSGAKAGVIIIAVYISAAGLAPLLAPYGETEVVGEVWEPFGGATLLGTDQLGRDLLTRLLYGARNTISIALATTLLAFCIGITTGFFAALAGGWMDNILSRIVDILMAIPILIFALMILSVVGTSVPTLIIAVAVLDSTRVFRLSRAIAMDVSVMDYVEVARLRGERLSWIMRREIFPNTLAPLVAELGLRFCVVLLLRSALSFLGLGIQPPAADWGGMLRENAGAITFGILTPLIPAAAIAVLTIGVNMVVDGFLQQTSGLQGD
jgi:peptide/nickel transport system permease protein